MMRLNQPLSTFLLVFSILAIVLGIFLLQSGYAWLNYSTDRLRPRGGCSAPSPLGISCCG
jgi:hypothetical protein